MYYWPVEASQGLASTTPSGLKDGGANPELCREDNGDVWGHYGALAYAQSKRARFVSELKKFIRFPTVSAQPQHAKI